MDRYSELGRHTPPPPPYSLSKRNPTKIPVASQLPAPPPPPPPPPPPYMTSIKRCDCMNPAISNLRPQGIPPQISSSSTCDHRNPTLLAPMALEQPARRFISTAPGQSLERHLRSRNDKWQSALVPALPIEPKWTPAPRDFFFSADPGLGPDSAIATSTCSNTLSPSHNCADPFAQTPIHVPMPGATTDAKLIRPFRKQSGKEIASIANIITVTLPGSIAPTNCLCPPSAISSMLDPEPKFKAPNTLEDILDVKNALHPISDSGSNPEGLSNPEDNSAHSTSILKSQDPACAAPSLPDAEILSKDRTTMFPGQDKPHRPSRAVIKRRYEPYRRQHFRDAETVEQRVGSGMEGGCEKMVGVEGESTMIEEEAGGEGERGGEKRKLSVE